VESKAPLALGASGVSVYKLRLQEVIMRFAKSLSALLLLAALIGCGAVGDSPVNVTPPPSTDQIKTVLNEVVQSGQLGSGGMTIESEIEKIRATDAAKADALKKDYDELKAAADPNTAKAKAQQMMSKL
jgi:hypothetical protein